MELVAAQNFTSLQLPGRSLSYTHLNPGASATVLYCYGAGNTSFNANLYSDYLLEHPELAILCIDRWCQGSLAPATAWLEDLSLVSRELLQHLSINSISIAAHSAGIYQALDLANRYPELVRRIYPMCAHIPVALTKSRMLSLLTRFPNPVLDFVGRLDTMDFPRKMSRLIGEPDEDTSEDGVVSTTRRDLVRRHKPSSEESKLTDIRREADYTFIFQKREGVTGDFLLNLYKLCKTPIIWHTSSRDAFFGPRPATTVLALVQSPASRVVQIDTATHGNILYKRQLWDLIRSESIATSSC